MGAQVSRGVICRELTAADPAIIKSLIAEEIGEFDLRSPQGAHGVFAGVKGVVLRNLAIYDVQLRAEARIETAPVAGAILLHVPLSGLSRIALGKEKIDATPERACIVQRQRGVALLHASSRHLVVRINEDAVRGFVSNKLGRQLQSPVLFRSQMDLLQAANFQLLVFLKWISNASAQQDVQSSISVDEYENLIIGQLILGQPNTYSEELFENRSRRIPARIAKAVDFISEHSDKEVTIDDIARASGLSVRALQDGFRRTYDQTPLEFLRNTRLKKARFKLAQPASSGESVTNIALECGFQHLGRFSARYKDRYGELPSQALRHAFGGHPTEVD